jgi:hypothetical protein
MSGLRIQSLAKIVSVLTSEFRLNRQHWVSALVKVILEGFDEKHSFDLFDLSLPSSSSLNNRHLFLSKTDSHLFLIIFG